MTPFLEKHGTKAFRLPPSAIVGAAKNDLRRRAMKKNGEEAPTSSYAFRAADVRASKTPSDLIAAAIKNHERGVASGKLNTRLIYGDVELLREALVLTGAAPAQ